MNDPSVVEGKREDVEWETQRRRVVRHSFALLPLTFYRSSMTARTTWLAVCFLCLALAAQAADPFYMRLLQQGTDAYNRRDFVAAEHQLRIACFGLLDEPALLADGLVRLGLAQASADDTVGFAETFQRLAEVEERFGGYSKASIPSEVRNAFQQVVLKLVPRSTLAERPAMARLIPIAEDRVSDPAQVPATPRATPAPPRAGVPATTNTAAVVVPAAPLAALQAPTAAPMGTSGPTPKGTAVPSTPTPSAAAPTMATPVPTAAPSRSPAPAPRGTAASTAPTQMAAPSVVGPAAASGSLTSPPPVVASTPLVAARQSKMRRPTVTEQRELDSIQELAGKGKVGDALQRAQHLADAQADLAEAQFVAAELAYRMRRFPEAVAYFRRGGDPGDARPLLLFYEAVSLYEAGEPASAAVVLKRSLPNIKRSSYVEGYVMKILGPGAVSPAKP